MARRKAQAYSSCLLADAGASRRANHGVFRHRALLFVAGIAATGLPGCQL